MDNRDYDPRSFRICCRCNNIVVTGEAGSVCRVRESVVLKIGSMRILNSLGARLAHPEDTVRRNRRLQCDSETVKIPVSMSIGVPQVYPPSLGTLYMFYMYMLYTERPPEACPPKCS